jgi:hypothetical protein
MDIGSISGFGRHMCMATLSPALILYQTEVDMNIDMYLEVKDCTISSENGQRRRRCKSHNETIQNNTYFVKHFIHRAKCSKTFKSQCILSISHQFASAPSIRERDPYPVLSRSCVLGECYKGECDARVEITPKIFI